MEETQKPILFQNDEGLLIYSNKLYSHINFCLLFYTGLVGNYNLYILKNYNASSTTVAVNICLPAKPRIYLKWHIP